MALDPNEQWNSHPGVGAGLRIEPDAIKTKTFASGSGTIPKGALVTYNESTGFWQVLGGLVNEQSTITANAVPATAGDFVISVTNPVTAAAVLTAPINFDATAAEVQAAIIAAAGAGSCACTQTTGTDLGDANAVVTVEWRGEFAGANVVPALVTDGSGEGVGLTGNAHVIAESVAGGSAEASGTDKMKGLAYPEAIELSATGEVIGNVMLGGRVHRDDIPLVAGSYGQAEADKTLREDARDLGILVEGLSQVR